MVKLPRRPVCTAQKEHHNHTTRPNRTTPRRELPNGIDAAEIFYDPALKDLPWPDPFDLLRHQEETDHD